MTVSTARLNDHLVICSPQHFSAQYIAENREALDNLPHDGTKGLVFNLSNTEVIDSSGIGVLIFWYKRLAEMGKPVVVYGLRGHTLRVFQWLNSDKIIPIYDTWADYCKTLPQSDEESAEKRTETVA